MRYFMRIVFIATDLELKDMITNNNNSVFFFFVLRLLYFSLLHLIVLIYRGDIMHVVCKFISHLPRICI